MYKLIGIAVLCLILHQNAPVRYGDVFDSDKGETYIMTKDGYISPIDRLHEAEIIAELQEQGLYGKIKSWR